MERKLILIMSLLFFTFVDEAYSQVGITYYNSDIAAVNLPIYTSSNNSIAGELKFFTNSEIKDVSTELDLFYRFRAREYHQFSVGVGFKTDLFTDGGVGNALLVPFDLEVFPLQELKRISFLFELSPEIIFEDQVNLRSLIGLRYTFGK